MTTQYNNMELIANDIQEMIKYFNRIGNETNTKKETDKITNSLACTWIFIRDYWEEQSHRKIRDISERIYKEQKEKN